MGPEEVFALHAGFSLAEQEDRWRSSPFVPNPNDRSQEWASSAIKRRLYLPIFKIPTTTNENADHA
jgi:hypothetical protein